MSIRYDLELKGQGERLEVRSVRGLEGIHQPWTYELSVLTYDPLDWPLIEDLLGLEGNLRASPYGSLLTDEGVLRKGVVLGVEVTSNGVQITFGARLGLLDLGRDYRVYLDMDALEITKQVLGEQHFEVEARIQRKLCKRPQCVQCWESRLGFLSRILGEEGIVYLCDPLGTEKILLVDNPDGFPLHQEGSSQEEGPLVLRRDSHRLRDADRGDSIIAATTVQRLRTTAVTTRDFDYEKPALKLEGQAGDPYAIPERYEFHGGFRTPDQGKELAQLRLASYRSDAETIEFVTTCRTLSPGVVTELESDEEALWGKWLVVSVEHQGLLPEHPEPVPGLPDKQGWPEGQGSPYPQSSTNLLERDYQAVVKAVPAELGYRLPPGAVSRIRTGLRTGTVMGARGTEIHPDNLGRIKLRHRWDRLRPEDETASSWTRVAQPALSGSMLMPRVNWEELAAHWGTGTDEPVALGRLVNGHAPPPQSLPGNKVWSAFGTKSTPGGGPGNRIAFNDTAKSEGMHINAGLDMSDKTANDKTTSVAATEIHSVAGSRELITGQVHAVNILGGQTYTVGSRKVAVDADKIVNATAETVSIGGARSFSVGGMQSIECSSLTRRVGAAKAELATGGESRTISGASLVGIGGMLSQTLGGGQSISVAGLNNEVVAGVKTVKASGPYNLEALALIESYGARTIKGAGVFFNYGGQIDIQSTATSFKGSEVVFKATSQITVKAGGATITITPGKVTIDANYKNSSAASDSSSQDYG